MTRNCPHVKVGLSLDELIRIYRGKHVERCRNDIFICLKCGFKGTEQGMSEHAIHHHAHKIAVCMKTMKAWCFKCNGAPIDRTDDLSRAMTELNRLPYFGKRVKSTVGSIQSTKTSGTMHRQKSLKVVKSNADARNVKVTGQKNYSTDVSVSGSSKHYHTPMIKQTPAVNTIDEHQRNPRMKQYQKQIYQNQKPTKWKNEVITKPSVYNSPFTQRFISKTKHLNANSELYNDALKSNHNLRNTTSKPDHHQYTPVSRIDSHGYDRWNHLKKQSLKNDKPQRSKVPKSNGYISKNITKVETRVVQKAKDKTQERKANGLLPVPQKSEFHHGKKIFHHLQFNDSTTKDKQKNTHSYVDRGKKWSSPNFDDNKIKPIPTTSNGEKLPEHKPTVVPQQSKSHHDDKVSHQPQFNDSTNRLTKDKQKNTHAYIDQRKKWSSPNFDDNKIESLPTTSNGKKLPEHKPIVVPQKSKCHHDDKVSHQPQFNDLTNRLARDKNTHSYVDRGKKWSSPNFDDNKIEPIPATSNGEKLPEHKPTVVPQKSKSHHDDEVSHQPQFNDLTNRLTKDKQKNTHAYIDQRKKWSSPNFDDNEIKPIPTTSNDKKLPEHKPIVVPQKSKSHHDDKVYHQPQFNDLTNRLAKDKTTHSCVDQGKKWSSPNFNDNKIESMPTATNGKLKLPEHKPIVGLKNVGNTCFFNSVLQIIYQSRYLQCYISAAVKYPQQSKLEGPEGLVEFMITKPPGQLTSALNRFLNEDCLAGVRNPSSLLNNLATRYKRFRGFNQQDSHEAFRCLLDGVKTEEIKRQQEGIQSKLTGNSLAKYEKLAKKSKSFVDETFGGILSSTIICRKCFTPTQLTEPFFDLSLPISGLRNKTCGSSEVENPHKICNFLRAKNLHHQLKEYKESDNFHTLEACLRCYTTLEVLDDNNKFICRTCTNNKANNSLASSSISSLDGLALCPVSKLLLLHQLPKILVLHLKRFKLGSTVTKINRHVDFPFELDVTPYCTNHCKEYLKNNKIMYSLYGVVVHHGTLHGGHYTAYVKAAATHGTTMWYYASDSHVRSASVEEIEKSNAYMLFYEIN